MVEVFCFGELMLRLSAPGYERLLQSPILEADFGGAEANAAVGLARWGVDVAFTTVLPSNPIADAAVSVLAGNGVRTDNICRRGGRMGIYYVETGSGYLPSKVSYDRIGSAISQITPDDILWPLLLDGAKWLHVSGITPAISQSAAEATQAAVEWAKNLGLTVSCDANYRSALWNYGVSPISVMTDLVKFVDLLIAGEDDFREMFGIALDEQAGENYAERFEALSAAAMAAFPNLSFVAGSLREARTSSSNGWSGLMRSRTQFLRARHYDIDHIVERVGTGDAFSAGMIYGLLNDKSPADALELAVAAGCLAHSIPGDFPRIGLDDIEALLSTSGATRVRR